MESRYNKLQFTTPILDFYRFFSDLSWKQEFKTKLKFKRCVLKVIMNYRKKLRTGGFSLFVAIFRIIGMKKMLDISWEEFSNDLDSGKLRGADIEIAQILHWKRRKDPVQIQMAIAAQDMRNSTFMMENKLRSVRDMVEALEEETKKTREVITMFENFSKGLKELLTY